jgi:hypothetical protein
MPCRGADRAFERSARIVPVSDGLLLLLVGILSWLGF